MNNEYRYKEATVTIPLWQYRSLLDTQSKVNVVAKLRRADKYITVDEIVTILDLDRDELPMTKDDMAEVLGYSD